MTGVPPPTLFLGVPGPPPKLGLPLVPLPEAVAAGAFAFDNDATVGLKSLSPTSLLITFFTGVAAGTAGAFFALASDAAVGAYKVPCGVFARVGLFVRDGVLAGGFDGCFARAGVAGVGFVAGLREVDAVEDATDPPVCWGLRG